MASRASLNKVMLIGNLTRDPELRYTPQGTAVCTFGLATNRTYTASDGQKKDDAEFHRVVSWNKLAELCSQLLSKGRKVYVEGRLQSRSWQTPAGEQRNLTEIVIEDMRILDSKRPDDGIEIPEEVGSKVDKEKSEEIPSEDVNVDSLAEAKKTKPATKANVKTAKDKPSEEEKTSPPKEEEDILDDLPF